MAIKHIQQLVANTFAVGDKVEVKFGGKWYAGEIVGPPHKDSGHYKVKAKLGTKTVTNYWSPDEIKKA